MRVLQMEANEMWICNFSQVLIWSRLLKDSSINFGFFSNNFIVSLLNSLALLTAKCALPSAECWINGCWMTNWLFLEWWDWKQILLGTFVFIWFRQIDRGIWGLVFSFWPLVSWVLSRLLGKHQGLRKGLCSKMQKMTMWPWKRHLIMLGFTFCLHL